MQIDDVTGGGMAGATLLALAPGNIACSDSIIADTPLSPMSQLQCSFSKAAVTGSPFAAAAAPAFGPAAAAACCACRAASAAQPPRCAADGAAPPRAATLMDADLDALLAACSRKPGYGAACAVDASSSSSAFAVDDTSSDAATDSVAALGDHQEGHHEALLMMGSGGGGDGGDGGCDASSLAALLLPRSSSAPCCGELTGAAAAAAAAGCGAGALPAAVQAALAAHGALPIEHGCGAGIAAAAGALIASRGLADTFYVYDMGEVVRLFYTWRRAMPRVMPFYAVKCNPEPGLVALLGALGAGFDCASVQELERAAALGVPQSRVIFAQPCKRPADFRYAAEKGVETTTFDCASELQKIAAGYPEFKCVLRIRCDDADAKINLGLKYGADMADVPHLLGMARDLGLQVVGVSFHVGSGCQNVDVYAQAIANARAAFDLAEEFGYSLSLLDVGGGFTAPFDPASAGLFYRTAAAVNAALEEHFPPGCGVRIIAEPGRYFAETSATLFTTILGQRSTVDGAGQEFRDYWLSDGTYGSFRIQVAVDGLEPSYSVLRSPLLPEPGVAEGVLMPCRLWGNSDRDDDCVHKLAHLPALRNGDWLMFPYAGAYTICSASNFGGVRMTEPDKLWVYSSAATRDLGAWGPTPTPLPPLGLAGAAHAAQLQGPAAAAAAVVPGADGEAGHGHRHPMVGDKCDGDVAVVVAALGRAAAADDITCGGCEGGAAAAAACGMEWQQCGCASSLSEETAMDMDEALMEVSSATPPLDGAAG